VRWQAETEGFSAVLLELVVDADARQLRRARLRYTDLGFGRARNRYCAEQLGIAVPAFVERHVEAVAASRRQTPPADLRDHYAAFVRDGGSLEWRVDPPGAAYEIATLADLGWAEALEALSPELRIRDAPVAAAASWWPRSPPAANARPRAERAQPEQPEPPRFRAVEVEDLGQWKGEYLRVVTHQGIRLEGVLERLETDRLILRRRQDSGVALLPVKLQAVEEVEVYR